jgi:hypothetical protein
MTISKSDFMAAEEIKGLLNGRDKAEQERIIRWISESLGLTAAPSEPSGGVGSPVAPPSPAGPSGTHVPHPHEPKRSKDIRSFMGEKKPKSDVQVASVIAYFYRFEAPQTERKETLNATDLDDAGRQARGYGFKKPLVTLNNARQSGYFDSAGRGQFKLNAVGENLVAMALPSTGDDEPGNGRARRKAKRANKSKRKSAPTAKALIKRSKMSDEGRARIVAAQKARWAKIKAAKPVLS